MNNGNSNHTGSDEKIVMTPIVKQVGHTVLRMERKKVTQVVGPVHEAGGAHKGIVISKSIDEEEPPSSPTSSNGNGYSNGKSNGQNYTNGHHNHNGVNGSYKNGFHHQPICLSFKVFLVNAQTNAHSEEWRQLRFFFHTDDESGSVSREYEDGDFSTAQSFFRDLVNPTDFPANYVGYIMKIMKLMQQKYPTILKMEVEMKVIRELAELPDRPASSDESSQGSRVELTESRVLEIIESSYPNAISVEDVASLTGALEEDVYFFLQELISKNLVKSIQASGHNLQSSTSSPSRTSHSQVFTRVTENDTQVKVVKNMPKVIRSQQPTIAIITGQFAEKLAVDAMIDNKDTYVRFKTEGESNVYTLGNIGPHRVVSTKLPSVGSGSTRDTLIASGNSTTRLLGTFQRVEYVFLVGVGGGVPHYTDYSKHVRLGDVVVSAVPTDLPANTRPYIYLHSGRNQDINSYDTFTIKTWCPPDLEVESVTRQIYHDGVKGDSMKSWESFILDGINALSTQETDFSRPPEETDKLFMSIGSKDVIEVGHPTPPANENNPRSQGFPVVHLGPIGSGSGVVKDDVIRQDIASKFGIKCFDSEFDSVLESIFGNRKDRYCIIRGISDYKDGLRGRKEWIPYASLAAASFMKSVILNLPIVEDEE